MGWKRSGAGELAYQRLAGSHPPVSQGGTAGYVQPHTFTPAGGGGVAIFPYYSSSQPWRPLTRVLCCLVKQRTWREKCLDHFFQEPQITCAAFHHFLTAQGEDVDRVFTRCTREAERSRRHRQPMICRMSPCRASSFYT